MNPWIEVKTINGKGRGVIAREGIDAHALVEVCPVMTVFDSGDCKDRTGITDYELAWGEDKVALVGGYAHFYNHSEIPNAYFERDLMNGEVRVYALWDIRAGEELTVKYACSPWFDVIE